VNVLILDDHPFVREYVSELTKDFFSARNIVNLTIKEANSISVARAFLTEGFIPDIVFSDYDLDSIEKGPQLFPFIREINPKAFICLMSARDRAPQNLSNVFIIKTGLQKRIPEILLQATA
jgi:DNA-binding NarL/FixJ family response regulator